MSAIPNIQFAFDIFIADFNKAKLH